MNIKFAQWFVYALITLVFYGLWAFFPKLASLYLTPREVLLYQIIGVVAVGLFIGFTFKGKLNYSLMGLVFSFLGGACGLVGTLFFLKSLQTGKTSVVVTMTALYPLITIILAVIFLRETITLKNFFGILTALAAMYLLTS